MDYKKFAEKYVLSNGIYRSNIMILRNHFDDIVSHVMLAAYEADQKFDYKKSTGYGSPDKLKYNFICYYSSMALMDFRRKIISANKGYKRAIDRGIYYNSMSQWSGDKATVSPLDEIIDGEDKNITNKEVIADLIKRSKLTKIQKKCVIDHYIKGRLQKDIASSLSPPVSRQMVSQHIRRAISLMKSQAGV